MTDHESVLLKPKPDYGRVGIITLDTYIDHHISRIEASLAALGDIHLNLEQLDRLERALTKGHAHNLLALDRIEEEVTE